MVSLRHTRPQSISDVEMDGLDLSDPRSASHKTPDYRPATNDQAPARESPRGCQASDRTIVRTSSGQSREVATPKDTVDSTTAPASPKDTAATSGGDGFQGGSGVNRILTIDGESFAEDGWLFTKEGDVIWVDFSPDSPHDPLSFPKWRKWGATIVAILFTLFTSVSRSLVCTRRQLTV